MGFFILILTIAVYLIRPAEWIPALFFNWNMLLIFIGLLVLSNARGDRENSFRYDRSTTYFVWFSFSMIISNIFNLQFQTILSNSSAIISTLIIFSLVQNTIRKPKQINMFISILVALILFICYQCYLQVSVGQNWGGLEPLYRALLPTDSSDILKEPQVLWYGVLGDPNDLGMLLVAFLPFIANKVFFQNISFVARTYWFLAMTAIIYTIILTNSRGSILALIAAVGSFFIIKHKSLFGVVLAAIMALALLALGPSRMSEVTSGDHSAMGRVDAWIIALHLFVRSPVFGIGARHFTDFHYYTTHNSFVLAFVENGIFGFIPYFGLFVIAVYTAIHVAYAEENRKLSTEIISLVSGLIGILISIFFISRTYVLLPFLYVVILMTYIRVNCADSYAREIVGLPLSKVLLICILFLIFLYIFIRLSTALLL
jgi:putative inorganic carbon (HCO3(-)) transporter